MKHRLRVRVCKTGEDEFLDFDNAAQALEHIRTQIAALREVFEREGPNEPMLHEFFASRLNHIKRVIATCDSLTTLNGEIFSPCLKQHYELQPLTPLETT